MNTREKLSEIKRYRELFKKEYEQNEGLSEEFIGLQNKYSGLDNITWLISELEKSLAREALAREALEFYADFAKKEKHQCIFDDETSSRAAVYERYKEYSIGDLGVKAHEALAKMDSIK